MARFTRPAGPAFIMLGMSVTEGRVRIYASTMLYDAQVDMRRDPIERRFGEPGWDPSYRTYDPGPTEITITARMGHVVMAEGATYAEALATLFGTGWTPEPEELALGRGREHGNDFGGPPTKELSP